MRPSNTRQKVVGWILLTTEEFLGALMPLMLVCLILMLLAKSFVYVMSRLGIIKTIAPEASDAEYVVFLLAIIVVPLLLRIARVLEEISRRMEQ